MMLFYPYILPNGLALCWLQNFRKLNQDIVTVLDYLYKAAKCRHWFSLYLFVLQANYQYILNDTKTNAQPMLST